MQLHEFLAAINAIMKPRVYAEVGVQNGTSLRRGGLDAEIAVGVDPEPLLEGMGNQLLFHMTSDEFFKHSASVVFQDNNLGTNKTIDLGFIDGLHHYEQALRDFLNMEKFCHRKSVIVFDDVLPRNQGEAAREQCPGDWTGDVWKVTDLLLRYRPELRITQVATLPTGTLMVWNFGSPLQLMPILGETMTDLEKLAQTQTFFDEEVPDEVLNRTYAVTSERALAWLKEFVEEDR